MKLLFKQRLFSWFDSYDIFDENNNTVFTVKGQLSWGHRLNVYDALGNHVATLQQRVLTFLPKFDIYIQENLVGTISKEFTLLKPKYNIDFMGWHIEGDFFEWEYSIFNSIGNNIAHVSKELFNWTDTYSINIINPADALPALMLVLAIDAEKCSRNA